MPYLRQKQPHAFKCNSPVLLAEGTDFPKFLSALCNQQVMHDPGCKVEDASSAKPKAKARNQFRITVNRLNVLYDKIEAVDL
ncbi:MvaI/BcnI family restriction endonuclease [Casimicrobium huifangae]|uniref:MvaI/BcnI family restriction endonuclease n=1 Tax=Casimicrobium huifangae TaxID=2591109 RepID=UPI003784BBCC